MAAGLSHSPAARHGGDGRGAAKGGVRVVNGQRDRIRVLWLAKGLGPGGMERLLVHHARLGDRSRFEYHAAYLVERPGSVVPELEALGVRCVRVGAGGADPRWVGGLRRLVRDRGIQVVHAHSPQPAALARVALRTLRPRPGLVYTEHNTWDCYGRATRWANLVTYPLDDRTFAVSPAAAASPPGPLARRVEVLTHGIDLDAVRAAAGRRDAARAELGVGDDTVVVLTVAHLRAEKAHDVLLDAAATVLAHDDRVVFVAVGHGPLEAEVRARHAALGLGDRFRLLGYRPDTPQLYAAADVFCLSSRQEGLPVAFMEAVAAGVAPVVTAVGGLPSVVTDGVDGLLVAPERPDLLAGALLRVAGDAPLRERLAAAARAGAGRFDARVAIARQEACYRELAG
jgi:glycosyltransferase involved in cell wall biosynthesis